MPSIQLGISDYATQTMKFSILNSTGSSLDRILDHNLNDAPLQYLKNIPQLLDHPSYQGLKFDQWTDETHNNITLLYNDSALLGLPNLIHTYINFYLNTDHSTPLITTISALPKLKNGLSDIYSPFNLLSLLMLGISFILPAVSYVTEIVHDREVI